MSYRNVTASTPERRSQVAGLGGKARWAKLTPAQRSETARMLRRGGYAKQAALRANPSVTTLRPAPSTPVSPAIALYREERERRTARVNALIDDAKALYARLYPVLGSLGEAGERECR